MDARLSMLHEAEDNYYVTVKYRLELAKRAYELFTSSEVEQKRQLVKLTLQNLRLEGRNLRYEAIKPFDTILNYADRQEWLERWNDYRRVDFGEVEECPEIISQQVEELLKIEV